MSKSKNLQSNTSQNLTLRGLNSVQVGVYLLIFAFILKSLLDGFLSDTSLLGMMSIQIIESVGVSLTILWILLSGLAVLFSSRRKLRRSGEKLWNDASKKRLVLYTSLSLVLALLLFIVKSIGFSAYLTTGFLLCLGILLSVLNSKKKKPLYLLSGISLVLAILVYFIPTYWYSSLLIVGIGFVVYGIMMKQ